MTEKQENDGGDAFPPAVAVGPTGDVYHGFNGMTLRDYFAGQALAGLAAKGEGDGSPGYAYWLADKMLEARHKEKNK